MDGAALLLLMGSKRIFAVGLTLPGAEFVEFNSKTSLLDADIIFFSPILDYKLEFSEPQYKGKPCLDETSSHLTRESIGHWSHQLAEAFNSGKTIIVHLPAREQVFARTGDSHVQGAGRTARRIYSVEELCNYNSIPFSLGSITDGEGTLIRLSNGNGAACIKSYWDLIAEYSTYHSHFSPEKGNVVLETTKGAKTVGCLFRGKSGSLVVLPDIDLPEEFTDYSPGEACWTKEAVLFGKKLCAATITLDQVLKQATAKTPIPDWVKGASFLLDDEKKLAADINLVDAEINTAQRKRASLSVKLAEAVKPKDLLFETGKPLELSILDALNTLGFAAKQFRDNESEFDLVFSSEEGRFIGEAEGKDSSAIKIDKFQQLERNIQEDFAKEGVTEHAKGVLFGNPQRLTSIEKRTEKFSDKVMSAAKRTGCALVLTSDLFPIVQYLKRTPDAAYAKAVRVALAKTQGDIVVFPKVPASQ